MNDISLRKIIKSNGNLRKSLLTWAKYKYNCYTVPQILKDAIKKDIIKIDYYNYLYIKYGLNRCIVTLFNNLYSEYKLDDINGKMEVLYKDLLLIINNFKMDLNKIDDNPPCYYNDNICFLKCSYCMERKKVDKAVQTDN